MLAYLWQRTLVAAAAEQGGQMCYNGAPGALSHCRNGCARAFVRAAICVKLSGFC
jgi:hypothetical protein